MIFFISLEVRPNMEVFHITLELSPSSIVKVIKDLCNFFNYSSKLMLE